MIQNRYRISQALVLLTAFGLISGACVSTRDKTPTPENALSETSSQTEPNKAVSARRARPSQPPSGALGIETIVVPLETRSGVAHHLMTNPEDLGRVWGTQKRAPKSMESTEQYLDSTSDGNAAGLQSGGEEGVLGSVPLSASFSGPDIDDDKAETAPIDPPGLRFIPPDPIGAAGPSHLVNVINVLVNFYQEDGTEDFQDSLYDFFTDLTPLTFTFDPKVVYDPFSGRFVIVTMDVTDTAFGDAADTARILVAVSDDGNPNGTWCVGAIDTFSTFDGEAGDGLDHWAEYPGLAADEEAVYITAEMRTFLNENPPDEFGGVRVWIINKASDGLYDCVSNPVDLAQVDVYDPFAGGSGIPLTSQPAQILGATPNNVGTFLVSKGNLTDGGADADEYAQVVRIDSPLNAPTFTQTFVNLGDIELLTGTPSDPSLPNAPQLGSVALIDTNDRRALEAVWHNDNLYFASTINPKPGDPDSGQSTAFWAKIDTTNLGNLTSDDQGVVLGEEIGAATHTFYPSIAVDSTGTMAIGFAASGATIYPGAYFTFRQAADPAGTTQGASILRAGEDFYSRTFADDPFPPGSLRNRWGDYTGISMDPQDPGCFWVFNQYAGVRDPNDVALEDGRWETQWGKFCTSDSAIFADGFESGDTSAWSSVSP